MGHNLSAGYGLCYRFGKINSGYISGLFVPLFCLYNYKLFYPKKILDLCNKFFTLVQPIINLFKNTCHPAQVFYLS
ncbi:MAG: hypothetical protein JWR50_3789 [Mucilaginibacter sp.]|nr:hypothetical protein [Mucilaginibacter sp.]